MKHLAVFVCALLALCTTTQPLAAQNFLQKAKQKLKDKVNARIDQKTDATMDKGLDAAENVFKNGKGDSTAKSTSTGDAPEPPAPQQQDGNLKVYSNYDFVPGDTVLFEDHFTDDQDGEFPSHWDLKAGQAILNKMGNELAFLLTDGNYAKVNPLIKSPSYLTDNFTIEYDWYASEAYPLKLYMFKTPNDFGGEYFGVYEDNHSVQYAGGAGDLNGVYPDELGKGDAFKNKWHHISIAYKKQQLKIYVDQARVLVVPRLPFAPTHLDFEGIGDRTNPLIFKNFRLASGGNMNMLGKKFTDAKIITHGINFDIDQASIKPESMGTLNMIVQVLKDNPAIKFEIDGHTDNSGTAAHNLTLSQQRADAVKTQLVSMGIDAARLTTKGFGDTKPISDNTSIEGKANNRRVEFVKQ